MANEVKKTQVKTDEAKQASTAELIWNSIKDRQVHMFALPSKLVSEVCEYQPIDDDKCFLTYKASSVIPALETTLKDEFHYETVKNYIVISKKS